MSLFTEYDIVTGANLAELCINVNTAMKHRRLTPRGEVFKTSGHDPIGFAQVMVKFSSDDHDRVDKLEEAMRDAIAVGKGDQSCLSMCTILEEALG